MRLKEQRLWDRFNANMKKRPWLKLERVENLVGVGFPDVVAIAAGGLVAMVELKAVDAAPARATTALLGDKAGASREQRNWHLEWARLGGNSYFLVGVGSNVNLLVPGKLHDQVNLLPLAALIDAACATNWNEIYSELIRKKL